MFLWDREDGVWHVLLQLVRACVRAFVRACVRACTIRPQEVGTLFVDIPLRKISGVSILINGDTRALSYATAWDDPHCSNCFACC